LPIGALITKDVYLHHPKHIKQKLDAVTPNYFNKGSAIMEGGHHHGFIAKLPVGPMAKKHGAKYAAFDPNGQKLGYVHGLQDAIDKGHFKPVGEGLPHMVNAPTLPHEHLAQPPKLPEPPHVPEPQVPTQTTAASIHLQKAEQLQSLSTESIKKLLAHPDVHKQPEQKAELEKALAVKHLGMLSDQALAEHFGHLLVTKGEHHKATQAAVLAMQQRGLMSKEYLSKVAPQQQPTPAATSGLPDAVSKGMFPPAPTYDPIVPDPLHQLESDYTVTPLGALEMYLENKLDEMGDGVHTPWDTWSEAIDDVRGFLKNPGIDAAEMSPTYPEELEALTDEQIYHEMKQYADVPLPAGEPQFTKAGYLPPDLTLPVMHEPQSHISAPLQMHELDALPVPLLHGMLTDASTKHEDKPAIIQQLAKRGAATPE
jgi:hypothetical protein